MKGMIKLNNNSLWRIILAVGMVVTLCFCSVGCGSDTAKLPSSDEISSSDTYVEVDKIESAEDSLSAAEAERAGDPELVLSTVGTQTQTDSLIVTQKEFVVTAPQYHPGIPGYDLKFTLDVRFNELPVNGDDYTIVSDLAGVEVNQNVVRVPANVKEANDRMTLTVTYKKDTSYQCKLVLAFKHWTPTLMEEFEELESLFPGEFEIEYHREIADYVYEAEKLRMLSGKKYHSKKNHINKFKKTYENWEYVPMSTENVEEAFQLLLKWKNLNLCHEHHDKNNESCVAANYLRLFEELEVCGGILRVDGQAVAFTIGSRVCEDTMVVHIEKALTEYEGAYAMINQQFVEHACGHVTYVNREDDTGDEGLRKAKLSYRPVFMVEKGSVKRKKR